MFPEGSQPHQKARGSLALHYACGLRPFRGWCLATEHCQAVRVGIARPTRSVEAVRFGLSRQSDTQRRIAATPSRRGPCPHSRHGVSQCKRNSHEWHYKALGRVRGIFSTLGHFGGLLGSWSSLFEYLPDLIKGPSEPGPMCVCLCVCVCGCGCGCLRVRVRACQCKCECACKCEYTCVRALVTDRQPVGRSVA